MPEKVIPCIIVSKIVSVVISLLPIRIAKCPHVINTPEVSNRTVFNNGKDQGEIVTIPYGGQTPPIHILGDKLKWKNAQKKEKKNIISDIMNNNIPK